MQTQLFSGTACFSPFVTQTLLRSWAMHGGTVARTYQERRTAQYYFCGGADDPWVARISVQELIVFDAAWIARCVREQFRVAIAPYVLDGAEEEEQPQQQIKKVHGKRRASERLASSSPAARNPPRAPKRARLGSSPDHGVKSEDSGVPHLDLAAKLECKRRARGGEDDFLQTIYEAEVGPGRFTVDAVLRSLEDVSIAGACVIECGEEHLGRRFRLCC